VPQLSRSQVDRLGRRLRRSGLDGLSSDDRDLLEQFLASYGPALAHVQAQLAETLGLRLTSRIKTTGTLIEKLQRSPSMALSRMQDIAGVRLVAEMNRIEQNQVVARITELFPGAEVKNRRAEPSYGYRAVHVIVELEQRLVEVQVRTALQDGWAQLIERFADWWGRGIRYGELPIDPDRDLGAGLTRRSLFELFMQQAERIDQLERIAAGIYLLERHFEDNPPTPEEEQQLREAKEGYQSYETEIRELYLALGVMK
jgi:hypothetical protein